MKAMKKRLQCIMGLIAVILLGLLSRIFGGYMPIWIKLYLGDILWGLMIYLLFRTILLRERRLRIYMMASLFAIGIEFSQLYHAPWIDAFRSGIGGLILGRGFLWSDVLCYILGCSLGWSIDQKTH